jgi:hypothetical protein
MCSLKAFAILFAEVVRVSVSRVVCAISYFQTRVVKRPRAKAAIVVCFCLCVIGCRRDVGTAPSDAHAPESDQPVTKEVDNGSVGNNPSTSGTTERTSNDRVEAAARQPHSDGATPLQTASEILEILDKCAESYDFPMLDNAYIYPAGVRMTLFRDPERWALVMEHLGFSKRAGAPEDTISVALYSYGNCVKKKRPDDFVTKEAYETWLAEHPYDACHHVFPISDGPSGPWLAHDWISVRDDASDIRIRGKKVAIPRDVSDYADHGVSLAQPPQIRGYELLRLLASEYRVQILATEDELRAMIPSDVPMIMQLDEWKHPDLAESDSPSDTSTFRMIAEVLHTGDVTRYRATERPNTHWSNWRVED